MTKAVIYNTDNGKILRYMLGDVPIDNQRLDDHEEILVLNDEDPNIKGMKVDMSKHPPKLVEDPDYEAPRTKEDIKQDLKNGDITQKEALIELLE
jgi:hypothetical protein